MDPQTFDWLEGYGDLAISYSLDFVGAIILLAAGWFVAGWAKRVLRRTLTRLPGIDETLVGVLSGLVRYTILILVLIAVLAQFGVQTASILAVLATAGLAIGLALQGALSNIAAGVMLLLLRPFKVGDYIDADGIAGTVKEIGLFALELTTYDGIYLSVPNGRIWSSSVRNYSRLPTRRLDFSVGISYDDDVPKALAELQKLLEGDERVLADPALQVMVKELADSSVNLNLRFWIDRGDYWDMMFYLNKNAKERLEAIGCTIPFPQRDLHIVNGGAQRAVPGPGQIPS
ncbi:MAG: mechanosensitive ion channel domain-containing protein [Kiloniellales bacterium]